MRILKAVTDALKEVIKWPGIVISQLGDCLGISEWAILGFATTIIGLFLGIKLLKK